MDTDIVNFPRIYALRVSLFPYWAFPLHSDPPRLYHADVLNVRLGVFRAYRSKFNSFIGGTCESNSIGTVVLIPNTMGALASSFQQVPSRSEVSRLKEAKLDEIHERYWKDSKLFQFGSPSDNPPNIEALRTWAGYLTERADTKSRFDDEHLDKQFAQVGFTQQITRLSPAAVYKYALESLAGTGFARHKRFIQQARRYRKLFVDFIKSEDSADNESYHVYLVKEGLSQKPVAFNSIPKFSGLTLGITFKGALLDLMLLVSLSLLLFMAAVLAFLRSDGRESEIVSTEEGVNRSSLLPSERSFLTVSTKCVYFKRKCPVVDTYNLLDQSTVGRGGLPQCPLLSFPLTTTPSLFQR